MMKTKMITLAAALALPAVAQAYEMPGDARNGFYLGAVVGYTNTDVDATVSGPSFGGTFSGSQDINGVDLGAVAGYRSYFTPQIFVLTEIEGLYSTASKNEAIGGFNFSTEKNYSLGAYVKPGYQFTPNFALFGTLGWKMSEYEAKALGVSDDEIFNGFTFGGGAQFDLDRNISMAIEYNRTAYGSKTYDYGGGDTGKVGGDENVIKVSFKHHF